MCTVLFGYEILVQLNPFTWSPQGNKTLKQQELSSNKYHYSWENIHILHWDWKSDSLLCGGIGILWDRTLLIHSHEHQNLTNHFELIAGDRNWED